MGLVTFNQLSAALPKKVAQDLDIRLISDAQSLAIMYSVAASLFSLTVSNWFIFICSGYAYDTLKVSEQHF